MQTLLIAEQEEVISNYIKETFCGEFDVHCCNNGELALEMIEKLQPDVLLLNLLLPYKDGMTLLMEMNHKPSLILAWSYLIDSYVVERIVELGVDELLNTPTLQTIVVRLADLLKHRKQIRNQETLQLQIARNLHLLRFGSHLDGYRQLCAGVALYYRDPHQNLSKELYPAIAESCGSKTAKCVEHSIRHAIEDAWRRRLPGVWEQFFSCTERCPTNKVFIAGMAKQLME